MVFPTETLETRFQHQLLGRRSFGAAGTPGFPRHTWHTWPPGLSPASISHLVSRLAGDQNKRRGATLRTHTKAALTPKHSCWCRGQGAFDGSRSAAVPLVPVRGRTHARTHARSHALCARHDPQQADTHLRHRSVSR